jgi:predicted metal-dependent TIM-barrel fold hydrolase
MALTEQTINDKIEVVNKGDYSCLSVRTATIIKRDGVEISRAYHRKVVLPNADLTQEDVDVSAIGAVVFTDAIKTAYAEHLANQEI